MATTFVRWMVMGLVLAGTSGCFGGGSDRSGEDITPAGNDRQAAGAAAPGKGAAANRDAPAGNNPAGNNPAGNNPAGNSPAGNNTAPAGAGGFVDASKLRLVEGKGWLDSEQGFVKIAGEVKNETGQWITSVRVTIRLYDAAGKEIGTDSITTEVAKDLGEEVVERTYSERTFVPPGETAVFYWLRDVTKIKGTYASHKLAARALVAEDPPTMALSGYKAEKGPDGRWRVSGKIQNTGRVGCRSPRGVLGLYGADGRILAAYTETPDAMFQKVLAPGQSVDFERGSMDLAPLDIARVEAWADCDVP